MAKTSRPHIAIRLTGGARLKRRFNGLTTAMKSRTLKRSVKAGSSVYLKAMRKIVPNRSIKSGSSGQTKRNVAIQQTKKGRGSDSTFIGRTGAKNKPGTVVRFGVTRKHNPAFVFHFSIGRKSIKPHGINSGGKVVRMATRNGVFFTSKPIRHPGFKPRGNIEQVLKANSEAASRASFAELVSTINKS